MAKLLQKTKIEKIIDHNENYRTVLFTQGYPNGDLSFESNLPGDFIMVRFSEDEKPMSLSHENGITIKKVGKSTAEAFKWKEGDIIDYRPSNARGLFNPVGLCPDEGILVIAGGIGIAPLRYFLETYYNGSHDPHENERIDIIYGGRSKKDIIFTDDLKRFGRLHISTEDGTCGEKCLCTELITPEICKGKTNVYICGKEAMSYYAAKRLEEVSKIPFENIDISLERYIKCGEGLCGACDMDGYTLCVDGPVFAYNILKKTKHFGHLKRTETGRLVKI